MRKLLLIVTLIFSVLSYAEEPVIALEKIHVNLNDKKSLQRGAKFFAATCMACHTLIYMRYNKLAKNNGVVYERMPVNVTKWPLDVKPPDLSLVVSQRGADWIYMYLHSFYVDKSRPTGVNNLLVPNTAMSGIVMAFQGQQVLIPKSELGPNLYHQHQWYDMVKQETPGSMTPEQFDETMYDVVNFLAYASEPYKIRQEAIGRWVLGFLLLLFVLMYLLKKSYWRDVDR